MNMGNMREISIEECNAVFGGTITVTGRKTSGWIDPQLLSSLMGGSYGGYLRTQALILATQAAPDVALDEGHVDEGDDDGDGILNRDEEIVVTAEKVNLPGGYYAYQHRGHFIIMKDGWITNTYQGTFTQGTPQDHDFVIKDSALEFWVKIKGVEAGAEVKPASERYFKSTKK
jgi:hypothetical protein